MVSVGSSDEGVAAQVHSIVAEALGADPDEVQVDENLIALGLDSLALMRLAARWRATGAHVDFAMLAQSPTISSWAGMLSAAPRLAPIPEADQARATHSVFPLAPMQHAYWVGRATGQELGGVASHLYAEFDGASCDVDRWAAAVETVVARHPALRTRFLDEGGQEVLDRPGVPVFRVVDLRDLDPAGVEAELERLRHRGTHQRLDITQGQVIDVVVSLLPAGRSRVHVDVDMIAADAMSYRTILRDLATAYQGGSLVPAELGYDFRTYLAAHEASQAPAREREAAWWADRIGDYPSAPRLPLVPASSAQDPDRAVRLEYRLDPAGRDRLYGRAREWAVTPAMVLATVFADVVARWSGSQRFLLNLPLFDREPLHPDIDQVVGDFSNSVLLDIDAAPGGGFVDRVRRTQQNLHEHAAHAAYRGLDVLRDLGRVQGSPVIAPVVYTSGLNLGELFADVVTDTFGEPVWIISQGSQVVLDAQVVELAGGVLVNWDIRRDAFPPGLIEDMFTAYRGMLDRILADDADWSRPLEVALPAAQREVRARVNDTGRDYPARTLHGRFFELAAERPDAPALLWGRDGSMSYGELADQALRIASALVEAGVRRGDTVAVHLPKGHTQIPAVFGVLAAGATYLPVGVDQPVSRRDVILDRGRATVVITGQDLDDAPAGVQVLPLPDAIGHARCLDAPVLSGPGDIAYVLFTSGSTGEPKGVEVPHRAAVNTIDGVIDVFDLTDRDRTLGVSVLEFDLSVMDIFAPLCLGGAFIAVNAQEAKDAWAWADLAGRYRASAITCAPGILGMLLDVATPDQLSHVHAVMLGGDWVGVDLARRLKDAAPQARFAGLGGTTETAIHATVCEVREDIPEEWATVPYGTPLPNFTCRVVNDSGQDCPDWVVGELWIGGPSVGAGYRGDPDKTATKFVEHDGQRWYRTGDLARYRPDGSLDFLGRADHQVKIRGYRVELGEIETALRDLPGVRQAIALTVGDPARLAAAVTGEDIDLDRLASALADRLPGYMIPEIIHVTDAIPLTPNGKIDRATLTAAIQAETGDSTDTAPTSDLEAALLHIIAATLPAGMTSTDQDFFAAGGDSIIATKAVSRIRGLLRVSALTVADFFQTRTVRDLAGQLTDRAADPGSLEQVATIYVDLVGSQNASNADLDDSDRIDA